MTRHVTRAHPSTAVTRRLLAIAGAFALLILAAAPGYAAPTLQVSATSKLTDGQTITISGAGFAPNLSNIAIGQCVKGYTGPADCNTSGGATFKNADASGKVSSFTIVVKEKFGTHDCTKEECVIAGAPLPTSSDAATVKANTYVVPIYFGDAGPAPTAAPTSAAPAPPAATTMATGLSTTSAATVTTPVTPTDANGAAGFLLLGAGALIAGGVGIMLLVPRRDRTGATS